MPPVALCRTLYSLSPFFSHSLSLCLSICTSVTLSLTVRLAALASKLFVLARFSLLGFARVSHKIENHILPFICPPATFFMHFMLSGYLHSPGGGSHREEIPAVIFGEVQFTNWRPCAPRPHRSSDWRAYCCGSAHCAGCAWLVNYFVGYLLNKLNQIPPNLTARDVVKYLVDMRITSMQDFDWMSQLRYYWKVNESEWQLDPCQILSFLIYFLAMCFHRERGLDVR